MSKSLKTRITASDLPAARRTIAAMASLLWRLQILVGLEFGQSIPTVVHSSRAAIVGQTLLQLHALPLYAGNFHCLVCLIYKLGGPIGTSISCERWHRDLHSKNAFAF